MPYIVNIIKMLKSLAFLTIAIFALSDSSPIVKLIDHKCSIKDNECTESVYKSIIQKVADNGIPEIGVPKADPLVIKNMNVNTLGFFNVTLIEGAAKGLKNCHTTSYKNDFEVGRKSLEVVCDLFTLEGSYVLESTPAFLALSNGINIHGKGKGSTTIEKLKLNLEIAFELKKHADCEIYFELKPEESTYTFDVLGKLTVTGDGLFVGSQDVSAVAVNIINEYWKGWIKIFGKPYFNKGIEFFYENVQLFLDNVPAAHFITEDLSDYVKNSV